MRITRTIAGNERGVALIMSLLALVVISVLAVVLMTSLNTDTKIVGHSVRYSQALNTAEAGVSEAMARISAGDVPTNLNPRMVSQIFLTDAGTVPVVGVDTTAMATAQPPETRLEYSTPDKSADVLKIEYKTDAARTLIYKYDNTKSPPVNTLTGLPIYVITATGQQGVDKRKIVTEVVSRPVSSTIYGALAANVDIRFSGNSVVCGYNHRADTPTGAGSSGRIGPDGCLQNILLNEWEYVLGGLPGAWTPFNIQAGGASAQFGDPVPILPSAPGAFYAGPWEALAMSQAEFFSWVGTPYASEPSGARGIIYLDNNSITQDQSGGFAYDGGNGEGLLYVDGDLTVNGNFTYRGLIYVEGDLKINGGAWILGSMIVRGKTEIKVANGSCTILYSKDAIAQNIAKYGGQFTTLSWRESTQ